MQTFDLTIAVDDVHPEEGWGLPEDKVMKRMWDLYEKFGAKFTLFVPTNYHGQFPLSNHKEWVDWITNQPHLEIAAHGHLHSCDNVNAFGECEFLEMQQVDRARDRVNQMMEEWAKVGYSPKGWRNPGWLCSAESRGILETFFDYAALHYQHNHGMEWACKMIFGADGIHKTGIEVHNDDRIMLHSHVAGDWNDNSWTDFNYNQLNLTLTNLVEGFDITFKTMREL